MTPNTLTRIKTDIQWLTKEIGPRPAFSSEVRLATLGIRDRLTDAGWTPQFVHLSNNLIAYGQYDIVRFIRLVIMAINNESNRFRIEDNETKFKFYLYDPICRLITVIGVGY